MLEHLMSINKEAKLVITRADQKGKVKAYQSVKVKLIYLDFYFLGEC